MLMLDVHQPVEPTGAPLCSFSASGDSEALGFGERPTRAPAAHLSRYAGETRMIRPANRRRQMFLVKTPYWLGIGADALWAIGLLSPQAFGLLTGDDDFAPDWELRAVMAIGGVLMTGWTVLLLWGVRQPIQRRFLILVTAFPVVFGLFVVALMNVLKGNTYEIWILVKCPVLFISMIISYILADRIANDERKGLHAIRVEATP